MSETTADGTITVPVDIIRYIYNICNTCNVKFLLHTTCIIYNIIYYYVLLGLIIVYTCTYMCVIMCTWHIICYFNIMKN